MITYFDYFTKYINNGVTNNDYVPHALRNHLEYNYKNHVFIATTELIKFMKGLDSLGISYTTMTHEEFKGDLFFDTSPILDKVEDAVIINKKDFPLFLLAVPEDHNSSNLITFIGEGNGN